MKLLLFLVLFLSFNLYASRCDSDKKKFCHNLTGARGEVFKCLTEHTSSLSQDCLKELKAFKAKASQKNPCFQELADYCSEVPNTQPNLNYCLMNNESRLGQRCLNDFKPKKTKHLASDVCAKDVVSHCYPEVKGSQGSITRCLIREKKKLSKACLATTEKVIAKLKAKNPCFDDTEKFCPTQVKMFEIQECLEKKLSQLLPQCKKRVQTEINLGKANPCYKDVVRLCRPNLSPEQQNECLTVSAKEVSSACHDHRRAESERIEKLRVSCEVDRLKHCKDIPFKGGLVLQCLEQKKALVSSDCRKYL